MLRALSLRLALGIPHQEDAQLAQRRRVDPRPGFIDMCSYSNGRLNDAPGRSTGKKVFSCLLRLRCAANCLAGRLTETGQLARR